MRSNSICTSCTIPKTVRRAEKPFEPGGAQSYTRKEEESMLTVVRKSNGAVLYRVEITCKLALEAAQNYMKRFGLKQLYKSIIGPGSVVIWVERL